HHPKTNDSTTMSNNTTTTSITNDNNPSETYYAPILPNPRPRQRIFNSNRQRIIEETDMEHDLDNYIWFGAGDADCSDQKRYDQGKIE
ncbi:22883_t:CDS:2, partial [Gigaspora margarita]